MDEESGVNEPSEALADVPDGGADAEYGNLRARAQSLADQIAERYLDLGEVLTDIRELEAWRSWGDFGSFFDWVYREFGFRKSRAEQLMCIWRRFGGPGLGLTMEQLGVDSWTKLRAILPVVDEDNAAAWLDLARRRDVTVEDIKRSVKRARERGSRLPVQEAGERLGLTYLRVGLYPEQASHVWSALHGLHAIVTGGDASQPMNLGVLFDYMAAECNELLLVHPHRGGVRQRLEWYVENLERVFNVRIEVRPRGQTSGGTPGSMKEPREAER